MKALFGFFLLCFGIVIFGYSIYFGLVEMLVGGIVDIINQIKAEVTDSHTTALAIVKILCFELPIAIGMMAGTFISVLGATLIGEEANRR